MKNGTLAKRYISRGYKGVLPVSIVMKFLIYEWNNFSKNKVSYKKQTEFISTSVRGKKRKIMFDQHIDKGYYKLVETKQGNQHDHVISVYELTEDGEDLFAILDL